jgi:hypothetical protein
LTKDSFGLTTLGLLEKNVPSACLDEKLYF